MKRLFLFLSLFVGLTTFSFGAWDLSSVTVDTAPIFVLATIVVTAIASIWAIKKVISLGNKS